MDAVERLNRQLLLAALVLGALAALAARAYLLGIERRALLPQTVPVVVAATDIPPHTLLTASMLTLAQYPPGNRPAQAVTALQDAVGAVTTVPLYRGQALVAPDLSRKATPLSLSYAVTPGMRAYTLAVSATSGVAGLLRPDDRVDVLAVFTAAGGPGQTTVDTLEQNLRVLAVGQRFSGEGGPVPTTYTTVTLEVTPAQAARLAFAASRGTLELTLRAATDTEVGPVAPESGAEIPGAHG
jgi:pilus assembly protein CpaB